MQIIFRKPVRAWRFSALAVFLLCGSAAGVTNVNLYQRVEESMTNATSLGNPFTDTELRLTVTAPAGRALGSAFTWYGFHDGNGTGGQNGTVWKFRVLFDQPGTWTIDAGFYVPGTATLNGPTQQFVYQVSSNKVAGEHGHIRVDPQNTRWLRHDDGTPWAPFNFHSSMLLDRDTALAQQWIDQHALLGVDALAVRFHTEANQAHGVPGYWHYLLTNGSRATVWLSGDPFDPQGFDYTRFDIVSWRHNEAAIEYAHSKGVKLSIWFGISGMNRQYWSYGPLDNPDDVTLGPLQKLFIKYFLARWAPYTCWWHWTVDSEYEETGSGALTRVRTYAAELQANNPWKTMLTTHVLSDWSPGYATELDVATLQRRVVNSDIGVTDCRSFITDNDNYDRPVYNAEGIWSLSNVTRSRVASWTHLMSGGFGKIAHGGSGQSNSWAVNWDVLNSRHKQDAAEMGKMAQFFNKTAGIDISRCVPRDDLVSVTGGNVVLCLAEPGQSYYVWADRGGTTSIDLGGTGGSYTVTRYRCTDLITPLAMPNVVGGGVIDLGATPTSGFGNDYLFVLKRTTPANPGDFDFDGDQDQSDFGHLQHCATPTGTLVGPGCGDTDLIPDNAINSADFLQFIKCMGGANLPPAC